MLSPRAYYRISTRMKDSGFWDFNNKEEDYNDFYNYVELALQELYKALDLEDAVTYEGYSYLLSIINDLREYQKNFDQFKIIPLR